MAITSAAGQTMMILAVSRAPAGTLAPFTYSEIVAAILIGFVPIVLCGLMVARAQGGTTLGRQPKISMPSVIGQNKRHLIGPYIGRKLE